MKLFILDGQTPIPATMQEYTAWTAVNSVKVAMTELEDISISTVFLGIDHSMGKGEPVLFETMVFGGKLDGYQRRYSTWRAAEKAHGVIVAKVKKVM